MMLFRRKKAPKTDTDILLVGNPEVGAELNGLQVPGHRFEFHDGGLELAEGFDKSSWRIGGISKRVAEAGRSRRASIVVVEYQNPIHHAEARLSGARAATESMLPSKVEAIGNVDDGRDGAAQIDDASHEARRVKQGVAAATP